MWMLVIALLGCIFALLKSIADRERQLELYKQAERKNWTMMLSNVESKKLLIHWIEKRRQGKEIQSYFQKHGIRRIAIYGMAEVGELLYQELKDTEVTVVCGIDRSTIVSPNLTVVKPEDFQEEVDAVVVTVVYYFSEVYDTMIQKVKGEPPILGLDEILYEL